ncbi:nuclear transport factor 2 family protein [Curtobacterium sp. MCBD17_040]|uniref:nuclear transport factor 2 family protein n=1 Tax=Curtobacterium sp. MCBD17_040 TaxID=2175674 RepID=UPI0015E8C389|nr:nuclear transport factor 2 family protein [Curtobacterium sp. MCBD17_040]WIB65859.1 nuclear transport factor 2 family protein [Curtobacterium sp. MCBD17_040]
MADPTPVPVPSVVTAEDALLEAMRTGDVARLDALTADWAVFHSPNGMTVSKADDLAAYASGRVRLERVHVLTRQHAEHDSIGQTSMLAHVTVLSNGDRIDATLSWTRDWGLFSGEWLLVAATLAVTR